MPFLTLEIKMTDWFARPLTTLAFAWRVERRDGSTLGFTSHDRDLTINGLIHRAAPGMLPSAIERSDGLDHDDVQLSAALTSDAFTDADLMAGRWDGAALTLSAVDWTAPDVAPVTLLTGEFGEVEIKDGGFAVGLASRLSDDEHRRRRNLCRCRGNRASFGDGADRHGIGCRKSRSCRPRQCL
jgi:uncharacterized phage protein (TIGR02218 family)